MDAERARFREAGLPQRGMKSHKNGVTRSQTDRVSFPLFFVTFRASLRPLPSVLIARCFARGGSHEADLLEALGAGPGERREFLEQGLIDCGEVEARLALHPLREPR